MTLQVWTPPSKPRALIARVIPLTQTRAIKGLWDYELPLELAGAGVGSLLRVPFSGRAILAVIAEMAETSDVPPEKLATAAELLPARLPADLVELAVWMASEYCSTPARALQILLPAGATKGLREKQVLLATLTESGTAALTDGTRLTAGQREALRSPRRSTRFSLPARHPAPAPPGVTRSRRPPPRRPTPPPVHARGLIDLRFSTATDE